MYDRGDEFDLGQLIVQGFPSPGFNGSQCASLYTADHQDMLEKESSTSIFRMIVSMLLTSSSLAM
jgi:hypothetical protein